MGLLSADESATLQADLAEELLTDSCEILRDSSSNSDGDGGYQGITWPTVATVQCAVLTGAGPTETVVAGKLQSFVHRTILLPGGTNVLDSDRLRVNSADTYQIVAVQDPTTFEILRRVTVWRET